MSSWTNFRDAIEGEIENVKLDELAKQELTEEAKGESGWCKIRDGIVLPYVLKAIMYIGKQALERTLANTVKEA